MQLRERERDFKLTTAENIDSRQLIRFSGRWRDGFQVEANETARKKRRMEENK